MISKEKLLGGYIKNEGGELMDLFREAVKYYFPDARTSVFIEFPQGQPTFFAFDCYLNQCMIYGSLSTNMTELTLDDFKPKPKNRFSIGDKVILDGLGVVYSTYRTMANRMGLDGYSHDRFPEANQDLTVVADGVHPDTNRRLLGVRDSYGYEYVVGESGLLLVEKNKPKTKVTYELVTDMTNGEIAKAMIDGEVFYDKYGIDYYQWSGSRFINNKGLTASCDGEFYRKVEKEIDWKDEGLNYVGGCKQLELHSSLNTVFTCSACDKGMEFDSEFLELCRVILRATGELK